MLTFAQPRSDERPWERGWLLLCSENRHYFLRFSGERRQARVTRDGLVPRARLKKKKKKRKKNACSAGWRTVRIHLMLFSFIKGKIQVKGTLSSFILKNFRFLVVVARVILIDSD